MFTSLLVGLDGSVQAQVALAQALVIGRRFRSRILLAHVSPPPGRTSEMALGAPWMEWTPGNAPHTRQEHEEAAELMLDDAAGAVRKAGLEPETVMREGHAAEVLRELADDVGVVVVGRVGLRGIRKPVQGDPIGPDTRELIRRSPRPVLVCGSRPTPMDRVLVSSARNPAAESVLAFASRYAGIAEARLDVLHVTPDTGAGGEALARASGALSTTPLDFDTHLLDGDPAVQLPALVQQLESNAFFVGAHREDSGWMVTSHAEIILRTTDLPVLIHTQPTTTGARTSAAYRRSTS